MAEMKVLSKQDVKDRASLILHTTYASLEYSPSLRFPVELIQSAVASISGFQIIKRTVYKTDMGELRGMLITFSSGQEFIDYAVKNIRNYQSIITGVLPEKPLGLILISDVNNQCWQRFTLVKELMHLVLEQDDLMNSTKVSELAKAVVRSGSSLLDDQTTLENRESAGVVAAIEILLPETIKDWMTRRVNVEGAGVLQIAYDLKVPQKFVEQRMDEWGLLRN